MCKQTSKKKKRKKKEKRKRKKKKRKKEKREKKKRRSQKERKSNPSWKFTNLWTENTRETRTVLNEESKSLAHKNNCKVKLVKLDKGKSKLAGVIKRDDVDNKTVAIQIRIN